MLIINTKVHKQLMHVAMSPVSGLRVDLKVWLCH